MDVYASPILGAMKAGVQVISNHRDPLLEIYVEVINRVLPEQIIELSSVKETSPKQEISTRHQEIKLQFKIVNIGGQRAERIKLIDSGDFRREGGESFGGLFDTGVKQMAPGQAFQLFLLDQSELSTANGDELCIRVEYYSPPGIMNWLKTFWARMRGKPHHVCSFRFSPRVIFGDLPPRTYC